MRIPGTTLSDTDVTPRANEIKVVWQSMSDDNGGICQIPGNYFWSYEAAKEEGDGWAGHPEPKKHQALVTDQGIFLLDDRIVVFEDNDSVVRTRALAKLSKKERKALGVK